MRCVPIIIFALASMCARSQMQMSMGGPVTSIDENILRHASSGTDLEPASGAPPMLMRMQPDGWMLMLHGEAAAVGQQQTGPRGRDKFFSVNWFMPMAQRSLESGEFTIRAMFSLEPATITGRFYPELFQQGGTAYGQNIVDGQHPHDFFMELAALYDRKVGKHTLLSLYAAPVGDPALGPPAFPHRATIGDDPLAPLVHHLQDATHISDDVLTGGVAWQGKERGLRLEASGFHGRETDEDRWRIEQGGVDSWSARVTMEPGKDWIAQYSVGHMHSPEELTPTEDLLRQTASVGYRHTAGSTSFETLAAWGRNHTDGIRGNANGYLLEGSLRLRERQDVWTRIENADRLTDLLGLPASVMVGETVRVQAFTVGYAHRIWRSDWSALELGAQPTFYDVPQSLRGLYGGHPVGVAGLLHWRIGH
jgi:hypothetical protein